MKILFLKKLFSPNDSAIKWPYIAAVIFNQVRNTNIFRKTMHDATKKKQRTHRSRSFELISGFAMS
jgi:hypothetical protein